jgi:FkbM family methyltransferase
MMSKLLRHLRSGTLLATSNRWLRSRFDSVRWQYAGYTIFSINPCGSIKLYRDSRLSELIRYGDFERAERTFVERFLKPDDVFVDVGANIGLYSVLAAGLVGRGGRVISFEPCRRTYSRLVENIRRNGFQNVSCVNAALSDSSGAALLYAATQEMDAWNTLATPPSTDAVVPERIVTLTWDDYCKEHGLEGRVSLMKIDVEGWETSVLKGASRVLSSPSAPVLQVEFCEENAQSANASCGVLFRALIELGYELYEYRVDENRMHLVSRQEANESRNLYAVKDLDLVLARLKSPCTTASTQTDLRQSPNRPDSIVPIT